MKTVLLDIESFPNESLTWGTYKQHVLEVTEHTSLCSYSAKWLDGRQVTRAIVDTNANHYRDDYQLAYELWKILDEADIVIAHYGDGFDLPFMRARFAKYRFLPPSPWQSIDTKKESARLFHFGGSYKLDHICHYLGLGEKKSTGGFDLWRGCMDGDVSSWDKMKEYNEHDVVLLQKLYLHLLPWLNNHPNVSSDLKGCPKCGSNRLQSRGVSRSRTRVYNRFQCQECGGWCKSTRSTLTSAVTNV